MEANIITADDVETAALPGVLLTKIENLQQAILTAHPTMPMLLKQIHDMLKSDPAIVTILSEEHIHVIVSGLMKQTKTELLTAQLKKTNTKALKNTTVDDL